MRDTLDLVKVREVLKATALVGVKAAIFQRLSYVLTF